MSANDNLPPLPQADRAAFMDPMDQVYTADQMREYALEAIEYRRQEVAPPVSRPPLTELEAQQVRNETYWMLHPLPESKP